MRLGAIWAQSSGVNPSVEPIFDWHTFCCSFVEPISSTRPCSGCDEGCAASSLRVVTRLALTRDLERSITEASCRTILILRLVPRRDRKRGRPVRIRAAGRSAGCSFRLSEHSWLRSNYRAIRQLSKALVKTATDIKRQGDQRHLTTQLHDRSLPGAHDEIEGIPREKRRPVIDSDNYFTLLPEKNARCRRSEPCRHMSRATTNGDRPLQRRTFRA